MKQNKENNGWFMVYLLIPIIMIVLKALGLIELSWLWILSPIWVPVGLVVASSILALVGLIIFSLIVLIVALIEEINDRLNNH